MKKIFTLTLSLLMIFLLTACGDTSSNTNETQNNTQETTSETSKDKPNKKALIVFFSRTGDNFEVGNISKGNTHILADIIAENVDADMFEIKPVEPYPFEYRECTEVAKSEQVAHARPAFVGKVENFDSYDKIYLGYPIWWGDLPMIVYTFLESYDFNGKTILPFCTSSSENFSGKESIEQAAKGATVLDGLGVLGKDCQYEQDNVKNRVNLWLKKVNG